MLYNPVVDPNIRTLVEVLYDNPSLRSIFEVPTSFYSMTFTFDVLPQRFDMNRLTFTTYELSKDATVVAGDSKSFFCFIGRTFLVHRIFLPYLIPINLQQQRRLPLIHHLLQ